jgi:hypothetical protein
MTKEQIKKLVGDDYWDWYEEILQEVIDENPVIHYLQANIEALKILTEHQINEINGMKGMYVEMKRENRINDILGDKED